MHSITVESLADITCGTVLQGNKNADVSSVSIDSRHMRSRSVFFALKGDRTDGHNHLENAFENGAIAAIVSKQWKNSTGSLKGKSIISVKNPLVALQALASWWRKKLIGRVVAITGSNGKTIVKNSLLQTLSGKYHVAGTPGSYNSQIGVPLSIVRIPSDVEFAVMEAGIYVPGEMGAIESMLNPNFGILTNIGMAHIASFGSRDNIADEKFKLFKNIPKDGWVLLPDKARTFYNMLPELQCKTLYFGIPSDELPFILKHKSKDRGTVLSVRFPESSTLEIFINTPSLEILSDIETAICAAYLLGVKEDEIAQALSGYEPSHTRMEIWRSPIGTTLINDSCSSDPISVQAALKSMERISSKIGKKIFVFGGMRELGDLEYQEHFQIGGMAAKGSVDHMVLVGGQRLDATEKGFLSVKPKGLVTRFNDTDALARTLPASLGPQDTILFKGPRNTGIDHVAQEVTGVIAPDRLIVDIQAITENISCFRRKVGSNTKILGMVKALAYGSNLIRLSKELQNMGLDHLGVSTPDEGVNLRKAGITLPILVMICTPDEVTKIVQNNLTPVINSFELVDFLAKEAQNNQKKIEVHLKVDTGMGRLGILPERLTELAVKVAKWDCLRIAGLMTHFACAEDPAKDSFTNKQIELFKKAVSEIHDLGYKNIIYHAAATAGTVRFPESHFDMVRIGLGLYGVYPSPAIAENIELNLAVSLVSRIAETRLLNKGHIIGYGATFTVPCDNFKVGVVPIGYHDGLPLSLSNNGHVLVKGKLAPIVGRISMDSMTIDLSDIPDAQQGSDVLIYGNYSGHTRRPEDAAKESGTISYELLTRLGPRIQRIYIGQ